MLIVPKAQGWDLFAHSEGQFSLNVKSPKKSRNGFPGPRGLGGQKSQIRVKKQVKKSRKVSFELEFRPREPVSRLFSDFFTFRVGISLDYQEKVPELIQS